MPKTVLSCFSNSVNVNICRFFRKIYAWAEDEMTREWGRRTQFEHVLHWMHMFTKRCNKELQKKTLNQNEYEMNSVRLWIGREKRFLVDVIFIYVWKKIPIF